MRTPILVSVVIPARNAAKTLERAVSSVLAQDYRPIEVIVVDDASSDETAAVAASFPGGVVRLIRQPVPLGAAGARNAGIATARGEIIAFQDADDEWLPGKLTAQVAMLTSEASPVFVACGCSLIAANGYDVGPLYNGRTPQAGSRAWPGLLACNTIATPSVVVWRDTLLAVGGFDTALPVGEDQDLWIRLAMKGSLGYLPAALVLVHATPNSLSAVGDAVGYHQQVAVTLPMVLRHVQRKRHELSRGEVRRILGERWGRLGRAAYSHRLYGEGIQLLLRAMLFGFEPVQNLWFLLSASPPARWLKRRLMLDRCS
jgi:glycosyltransferase involved in cell wall biosynthesis